MRRAGFTAVIVASAGLGGCSDVTSTADTSAAHFDAYYNAGWERCGLRGVTLLCTDPSSRSGQLVPVFGSTPFSAVSLGWSHGCALAREGRIRCWGSNWDGELGRDGGWTEPPPFPSPTRFTSVHASLQRSCALDIDGAVWCWGALRPSHGGGPFGWPTDDLPDWCSEYRCPYPAMMPSPLRFTTMGLGWSHACGLTSAGVTWCWGDGAAPARVDAPRFVALAVTAVGACGLDERGAVWCWDIAAATPAAVPGRFTAVSGGTVACALDRERVVSCWLPAGGEARADNPEAGLPVRVPGMYFDRLLESAGAICAYNRVSGVACWSGDGAPPEVVDGQV